MSVMTNAPQYLSVKEAARRLGVSTKTVDRKLKAAVQRLPHYRIGRRIIIDPDELDRWIRLQRGRPNRIPDSGDPDIRAILEQLQGTHPRK